MPARIKFPESKVVPCPHNGLHPNWSSSQGVIGMCMMAPQHLRNAIRMQIQSMRAILITHEAWPYTGYYMPDYVDAEYWLEQLLNERRRRAKAYRSTNAS